MKNLYRDTRELDKNAITKCGVTEDIMMENAATAMENKINHIIAKRKPRHSKSPFSILIVCGGGNNGGDGYTLARRLAGKDTCAIIVWKAKEPTSPQCILQNQRMQATFEQSGSTATLITTEQLNTIKNTIASNLIIVDCFIGSGFSGTMRPNSAAIVAEINNLRTEIDAYVLSCDVPSGLPSNCSYSPSVVNANCTVTMGALKTGLYSECAKKFAGKIICADLGIYNAVFEKPSYLSEANLLEPSDIQPPHRLNPTSHKGSFGHATIFTGEKLGAAVIAGTAAFSYGAGLVSLTTGTEAPINNCPFELMQSQNVPEKTTAVCAGPGLGRRFTEGSIENNVAQWILNNPQIDCLLDADMCYYPQIAEILKSRSNYTSKIIQKSVITAQTVITPHPIEFASILRLCNLETEENCTVSYIENHRLELVQKFCTQFPWIALILKGSTQIIGYSIIGQPPTIYINPLGQNCLAKGGSGDVLSGLITALLAQQDSAIEAAIGGSLALAVGSERGLKNGIIKNDYSMSPFDLIEAIKGL